MTLSNEVFNVQAPRRTPDMRDERGIALVLAIVALVVIGALVAGTYFISSVEQKTGRNTVESAKSFQAAEAGLQSTIGNWNSASYNGIAVGDSMKLSSIGVGGGSTAQVTIFPLNSKLFLLKSAGTYTGVTQTLASMVQLSSANINVNASISVTAPVKFNGSSYTVSGKDTLPANSKGCPIPKDSVVALRSSTTTGMATKQDSAHIFGLGGYGSAVANDGTVTSLVNDVFGTGGAYDALKAAASKTLGPATYTQAGPSTTGSPATCNTSAQLNWGEPDTGTSAVTLCNSYYPIVYSTSSYGNPFKVSNGKGQGVMIVDGDLELAGGFQWSGLILVKGSFKITGTGNKVYGAVVAQNGASVDDNSLGGNTVINYSSCSITNALKATATVVPLGKRSWTQMF